MGTFLSLGGAHLGFPKPVDLSHLKLNRTPPLTPNTSIRPTSELLQRGKKQELSWDGVRKGIPKPADTTWKWTRGSSDVPLHHLLYPVHQLLFAHLVVALLPHLPQVVQRLRKDRPFGHVPAEQVMASDGETRRGPALELPQQLLLPSVLQQLRDPVLDFGLLGGSVTVQVHAVAEWWGANGVRAVLQDEQRDLGFLVGHFEAIVEVVHLGNQELTDPMKTHFNGCSGIL